MHLSHSYVGSCFTCRVGKYNQRVVVIEQVGKNGVCWYREMRMKIVARSPAGWRTMPTKTLRAAEPLEGLPLHRGYLRYREMISVTGRLITLTQMHSEGATWDLTDKNACYEVLEDGHNVLAVTMFP